MRWRHLLPRVYDAFFAQHFGLLPSQVKTIPKVLEGKNVLLIAPTGSGKTEAVVAPIAERALDFRGRTYALYIVPTRALINDLETRLKERLAQCELRLAVRHGERNTIRGKVVPSIILTTPESLEVMLTTQPDYARDRLRDVRTVIVDETHLFHGTRRGLQLYCLLERLKHYTKHPLQRIGLSATVANPQAVAEFLQGSDAPLEIVSVPGRRKMEVYISHLFSPRFDNFADATAAQIHQDVLANHRKVLIFANTRVQCDWLAWQLSERVNVPVLLHYSSLHRDYREWVEREFRQARRAVCVSTSTLELGVDIGDIDAIVLWSAPHTVSSFLQRIGRGNRRTDTSVVYCICPQWHPSGELADAEDDTLRFLALIRSAVNGNIETHTFPEYYSVILQQLAALCIQFHSVAPDAFLATVQRAPQFAHEETLHEILNYLASNDILAYNSRRQMWLPTDKFHRMRGIGLFWSNIGGDSTTVVIDESEERNIPLAELPREYAVGLNPGRIVVLAGKPRLVTQVDHSGVRVLELQHDTAELARYFSPPEPTPGEVAHGMRDILTIPDTELAALPIQYDCWTKETLKEMRHRLGAELKTKSVISKWVDGRWILYTFAGSLVNWVVSDIIRDDQNISANADSWRISCANQVDTQRLQSITPDWLRGMVERRVGTYLQRLSLPPLFRYLPRHLQKREIETILDIGKVIESIKKI